MLIASVSSIVALMLAIYTILTLIQHEYDCRDFSVASVDINDVRFLS